MHIASKHGNEKHLGMCIRGCIGVRDWVHLGLFLKKSLNIYISIFEHVGFHVTFISLSYLNLTCSHMISSIFGGLV